MGRLAAASATVLDVAARCAVIVVCALLAREFWGEPEPNGDGLPVRLLIPPLAAYVVWNVWIIARLGHRWVSGTFDDSSFLALLGALSLARLLWLLPLADDLWWHHRHRLMVLVAVSVATAVLALGTAIRLAKGGTAAPGPASMSGEHIDPLDTSRS